MRILTAAAAATLFVASSFVIAQGPEPGSAPEQATPPARTTPPARATAPAQAAVAPLVRADRNSPAQAGRNALYKYLDDIAAKDEAARRETMAKITTRAQAEARQQQVRTRLLGLMGGGFEKTPLNAKVVGSTEMEGYRIEKVVYESQPKFYVTALLYVPDDHAKKLAAIVMAPGHAASGKAGDFAMASTFARNGFVVLSYDPIGQGERLQYPDGKNATATQPGNPYPGLSLATRPTGEHGEAGLQPTLIGDAVARYFLWDGMRAVDYLQSRPEVDAERIGAFGCSGGGAMTALLGALDTRVKATATACYITSMDTLLPSIGPQDAEQSTPGFIAAGFDFADWVELAAPRPYAIVGTVGDMFPWAGLLASAAEARRFYSLFDASAEGTAGVGSCQLQVAGCQEKQLPTPTGPTLNPDTSNEIPANAPLQVIAGIGGHGNLRPLTSQIVRFFLVNSAGRKAEEFVPGPPPAAGASPFAAPNVPAGALQVTATGQVATSYPGGATVFSLNLKRAAEKIHAPLHPQTLLQVQTDVREVTEAEAAPGTFRTNLSAADSLESGGRVGTNAYFQSEPGIGMGVNLSYPETPGRHPAVLVVLDSLPGRGDRVTPAEQAQMQQIEDAGKGGAVVLVFPPRPSPPGGEETKSPILGPFYMTELRAEQVGRTLLGMRLDDVIRAVDYLASRPDVDAKNITVVASGHMGLVALHAAVLDSRIKHVTVDHVLESYRSLLDAPMPLDAPQDVLPGVLLKYDIPDLARVLGARVTATDWLAGTANLAGQ